MTWISETWTALKDGKTEDGKFWAAVVILAAVFVLLLSCMCGCFAWRRHKRRSAFRRKLNDAIEPEGMWHGGEATAPIAAERAAARVRCRLLNFPSPQPFQSQKPVTVQQGRRPRFVLDDKGLHCVQKVAIIHDSEL